MDGSSHHIETSTQPVVTTGVKGWATTERSLVAGHALNECLVF